MLSSDNAAKASSKALYLVEKSAQSETGPTVVDAACLLCLLVDRALFTLSTAAEAELAASWFSVAAPISAFLAAMA